MSIAFAQQTELSRLSEGKENTIQSEQAHTLCSQNKHQLNDITSQSQVGLQTFEATDKNFKEEFKPLSKELGEYRKAVPLSSHDDLDDILKSEEHGLAISEEIFSKDETFIVRKSVSMTPGVFFKKQKIYNSKKWFLHYKYIFKSVAYGRRQCQVSSFTYDSHCSLLMVNYIVKWQ